MHAAFDRAVGRVSAGFVWLRASDLEPLPTRVLTQLSMSLHGGSRCVMGDIAARLPTAAAEVVRSMIPTKDASGSEPASPPKLSNPRSVVPSDRKVQGVFGEPLPMPTSREPPQKEQVLGHLREALVNVVPSPAVLSQLRWEVEFGVYQHGPDPPSRTPKSARRKVPTRKCTHSCWRSLRQPSPEMPCAGAVSIKSTALLALTRQHITHHSKRL